MTRVVYHFQGQSGRFTVWANCKQNSGLLILSRNRLSHLYKSVPFTEKTDAKTWKRNHLEHSVRKNRITLWGIPLLPQIFRWDDPESRVPFTFQPDFPTKITPKALPFAACTKTRKTSEQSPTTLGNNTVITQKTWQQVGKITSSQPAINFLFLQTTTDKWNMRRVKLIFNFFSLVQLNLFSL